MPREKGMDVGGWIVFVILAVVLFAVLAGLYPTFAQEASAFANATGGNPLATVLVTLLPYLVAAGILLVIVYELMPAKHHR
jgi:Na+/proline symporter